MRTGTAGTTAEARRQARPTAVHWGIREHARQWVRQAGPQLPTFEIPRAEREIYPDLAHAPDWEQAIAATSFVPDELVARLCDALRPVGAPEYCARRETSPFRTGEPALGGRSRRAAGTIMAMWR